MPKPVIPLVVLLTALLAACAGQTREARCQASGHAVGSAGFTSCVEAQARQDRIKRNRLRKFGQASGG